MAIGHKSYKSATSPTRVRSAWLRFGYGSMDGLIRFFKTKKVCQRRRGR